MTFLPQFEVARSDSLRQHAIGQVVVETNLTPPISAQIGKVMSITTRANISPAEVFVGEARFVGKLHFTVVYVDIDGFNRCIEHTADFSDKLVSGEIVQNTKPIFVCNPLDTDTVSVGATELRIATVVEVKLFSVANHEIRHLTGCGDDVYTHDESIEYDSCIVDNSDNFVVTDTYLDGRPTRLIAIESSVVLKNARASVDSVICEGTVFNNLIVEVEGGLIKSTVHTIPFTQELQASGVRNDARAVVLLDVGAVKGTQTDGSNNINLDIQILTRVIAFKKVAFSPITDAFCVENELNTTTQVMDITCFKHGSFFDERVEGTITLNDDLPIADNILATVAGKLNLTKLLPEKGRISIEGVVNANIIYYNQDRNAKYSVSVELPFGTFVNDNIEMGDVVTAQGSVININARLRRGNEIEVKADIGINTIVASSAKKQIIVDIQKGEPVPMQSGAFSIHIAKSGETLWDIAKALGATPEQIMSQNPSLVLPLVGNERVIAYRQLLKKSS